VLTCEHWLSVLYFLAQVAVSPPPMIVTQPLAVAAQNASMTLRTNTSEYVEGEGNGAAETEDE